VTAPVVAITGANGFIGKALCGRAVERGRMLRRFVHTADPVANAIALDLTSAGADELMRALTGVSTLVHLACRVHVMDDRGPHAEASYRDANERVTQQLARAAVAAGVRRFIFASTVKVNGEVSPRGKPLHPDDAPAPADAYARSKLAAERALEDAAHGSSMSVVVLRLPLVYGPRARGNFRRLVDAVRAGRALPFGAIANRRSVIGIANLLDALDAAIDAPASVGGTHFVADADSVSTPGLVRAIARALTVEPRLVAVPVPLLRIAGALTGRSDVVARVTGSLEVDPASFAMATGWRPRRFAIDATMVSEL
jgi:nucleoside-diphosphate-sugar epimerase